MTACGRRTASASFRRPWLEPLVRVERDGDVALLTFDDPDRLNAMTEAMGQALRAATLSAAQRRDPARRGADRRRPRLLGGRRPRSASRPRRRAAASEPGGRGARGESRLHGALLRALPERARAALPHRRRHPRPRDRRRALRGPRLRPARRGARREARPQLRAPRHPPGHGGELDAAAPRRAGARGGAALHGPHPRRRRGRAHRPREPGGGAGRGAAGEPSPSPRRSPRARPSRCGAPSRPWPAPTKPPSTSSFASRPSSSHATTRARDLLEGIAAAREQARSALRGPLT